MTKLLLLQLLLTFVVTAFAVPPSKTFSFPPGCGSPRLPPCVYTASWTMVEEGISVTVTTTSTIRTKEHLWAAIGFMKEKNPKVDIISGGYLNKKKFITHGLLEERKPLVELKDLLLKSTVDHVGDKLVLKFIHPIQPSDKKDFTFKNTDCYTFLFFVDHREFTDIKNYIVPKLSSAIRSKMICVKDLTESGITSTPEHVTETPAPIGDKGVPRPVGEEVYPPTCKGNKELCDYIANWTLHMDRKVVKFHLETKQSENTYAAVGFTTSKAHKSVIYSVIGYKNRAGEYVVTLGQFPIGSLTPKITNVPGLLQDTNLVYENERWIMDFEINIETTRTDIINLKRKPYFLVLHVKGGPIVKATNLPGKLTKSDPPHSPTLINFVGQGTIPHGSVTPKSPSGDVIFRPNGEERYTPGCRETECAYRVKWELIGEDKDIVKYTVISKQREGTYVAFGFSTQRNTNEIHVVYAYLTGSEEKHFIKGKILNGVTKPQLSDSNGLENTELEYENGFFTLEFEISLEAAIEDFVDLQRPYYYVLMVDGGLVQSNGVLGPLLKKVPQFSTKMISVVVLRGGASTLHTTPMITPVDIGEECEFKSEGEEKRPLGCGEEEEGEPCDYELKWEVSPDKQTVEITVNATQPRDTYIGVGFSLKKKGKIHVVYGYYAKSGRSTIITKGEILPGSTKPKLTDKNDIVKPSLSFLDNKLRLNFKLKLKGTGPDSLDLTTKPYFLVFLVGGGSVLKDTDIGPLKKGEPEYTKKKHSFLDTVTCVRGPPAPFHIPVTQLHAETTEIPQPFVGPTEETGEAMTSTELPRDPSESRLAEIIQPPPQTKVRFCNFANWAQHYPTPVTFLPKDIDPTLCTHINYCFFWLKDGHLIPTERNDEKGLDGRKGLMQLVNDLKNKTHDLKTILSVGGYDMDIKEMSKMLKHNRTEFIDSSIKYLRKYNFDGINLMFMYPGWGESPREDKDLFMKLVKEMKESFVAEGTNSNRTRLRLVVSVTVLPELIARAYNVPELNKHADMIQLLAYDLHGGWERRAFHHAPLKANANSGSLGMAKAVETWTNLGADNKKLIIGIPLYGRGGVLSDPNKNTPGSSISRPSPQGKFTKHEGMLAYYEICEILKNKTTTKRWIKEESVPYIVYNGNWMGYENGTSVHLKAKWVMKNGLLGASTWITNFDDFKGSFCGLDRYPLIRAVSDTLQGKPRPDLEI